MLHCESFTFHAAHCAHSMSKVATSLESPNPSHKATGRPSTVQHMAHMPQHGDVRRVSLMCRMVHGVCKVAQQIRASEISGDVYHSDT